MPARTLGLQGGGHRVVYGVSARILGPEEGWIVRSHINWREMSASKDVGPEMGWIVRSHIG